MSTPTASATSPRRTASIVNAPQPDPISKKDPPFGYGRFSASHSVPMKNLGEKTLGKT
jgi:hypothetical protein